MSLLLVLSTHILVRLYFDPGFHLKLLDITSIRGVVFSIDTEIWKRFLYIPELISNSILALPDSKTNIIAVKIIFYFFGLLSVVGLFNVYEKNHFKAKEYLVFSIILLFFLTYISSPFFYSKSSGSYNPFRHLTYITPLVGLALIYGISSLRQKYFVFFFLLFTPLRSGQVFDMKQSQKNEMSINAVGWILGTKLVHDTEILCSIIADNPEKRKLLIFGIGWGASAALMENIDMLDPHEKNLKIKYLINLIYKYPNSYKDILLEGVKRSFGDQVTPKLDKNMLLKIEEAISKK